jgi:L-threonylcarbamoyladenylate synthase
MMQMLGPEAIIAYPTEAVWGLGCDPFSESAVEKIRQLKNRPSEKGMILLVSDWAQIQSLVDSDADINWEAIRETWPGPVTWVFPASKVVPDYLKVNGTIALRMPSFPFLRQMLKKFAKPLVSTSANLSGKPPAKTAAEVAALFPEVVIYSGECEGRMFPSAVYDALSGKCLRKGS